MKGLLKTFLSEKGYGFIKGEDDKDYFFHVNELKNKSQINLLAEDITIEFEQSVNQKGYKAINCAVLNSSEFKLYTEPDSFIQSKSPTVNGWSFVRKASWIVHGSSKDSPDAAKNDLMFKSKRIGANAVVSMEYYKTTGREGNYRFTIHNYRASPVCLGKKHPTGAKSEDSFPLIDDIAPLVKKAEKKKTNLSILKCIIVWFLIILAPFNLPSILANKYAIHESFFPTVVIGIIIGAALGRFKNYDKWLQKSQTAI